MSPPGSRTTRAGRHQRSWIRVGQPQIEVYPSLANPRLRHRIDPDHLLRRPPLARIEPRRAVTEIDQAGTQSGPPEPSQRKRITRVHTKIQKAY
jgi:hypothetical protein